jgi:hypothetical protein
LAESRYDAARQRAIDGLNAIELALDAGLARLDANLLARVIEESTAKGGLAPSATASEAIVSAQAILERATHAQSTPTRTRVQLAPRLISTLVAVVAGLCFAIIGSWFIWEATNFEHRLYPLERIWAGTSDRVVSALLSPDDMPEGWDGVSTRNVEVPFRDGPGFPCVDGRIFANGAIDESAVGRLSRDGQNGPSLTQLIIVSSADEAGRAMQRLPKDLPCQHDTGERIYSVSKLDVHGIGDESTAFRVEEICGDTVAYRANYLVVRRSGIVIAMYHLAAGDPPPISETEQFAREALEKATRRLGQSH